MEPFEPPKYLEKLIAAINDGAKSAQLGALAFTAIGVFLLATAFSATDEDLLLNRALTISQLGGTAVPVVFAFGLAPAVFVAAHFYTLIRYDMLAGNVRQFREDLAAMAMPEADRHRWRQLLANVEFVNALAMPKGSRASSWMFSWTVRALLAVFPVAVLLSVQLQSLRLQSEWINWTHHACIAADLVLLVWFFGRLRGDSTWHFWRSPIRRKAALCWIPLVVLVVDLAWLRVPGPDSETVGRDLILYFKYPKASASFMQRVGWWVASNPVDLLLCTPGAWGCRYLTVTHRVIVAKVWDATTFVALRAGAEVDEKRRASFEAASLRGRTLRFADLTASELFAADLTDADLRHANLSRAALKKADLSNALLQGADLVRAELQGADLSSAELQGANLSHAELQGANMSNALLQGARLYQAGLQGANLILAQLQGASLDGVRLQGARLLGAQLQGANLARARLQGADLYKAQLQGADLRQARLWNIDADDARLGLADLSEANFSEVLVEVLLAELPAATPTSVKQQLRGRLTATVGGKTLPRYVNTTDGKILVTNPDDTAWRGLDRARQLTSDPADIDPALAQLLADTVAPISPQAAEIVAGHVLYPPLEVVASRVVAGFARRRVLDPPNEDKQNEDKQRPLTKLLGCRLQTQVDAKRVTLRADTIDQLRKATGPCDPASPTPGSATGPRSEAPQ